MATTWDPNFKSGTITLSGGNVVASSSGAGGVGASRSFTGRTYFEVTITTLTGTPSVGIYNRSGGTQVGDSNNSIGYRSSGAVVRNNATVTTLANFLQGDVIGVAVDIANRLVWFRVNSGNWNNDGTADPATGVGGIDYSGMNLPAVFPGASASASGTVLTGAFSTFTNSPPASYSSVDSCQATAVDAEWGAYGGVANPITSITAARSVFQMGRGPAERYWVAPLDAILQQGFVAKAYSTTITAQGGVTPCTFTVLSGALPLGLSLDAATGVISGTPTTGANYGFTIQATDANGVTGSTAFSINIGPPGDGGNSGYSN